MKIQVNNQAVELPTSFEQPLPQWKSSLSAVCIYFDENEADEYKEEVDQLFKALILLAEKMETIKPNP